MALDREVTVADLAFQLDLNHTTQTLPAVAMAVSPLPMACQGQLSSAALELSTSNPLAFSGAGQNSLVQALPPIPAPLSVGLSLAIPTSHASMG